uniref:Uncharacterized protein n=1 Tax=Arundo donax TaxID=35708 RepID=A0A0A8ZNU8_ARUDO
MFCFYRCTYCSERCTRIRLTNYFGMLTKLDVMIVSC